MIKLYHETLKQHKKHPLCDGVRPASVECNTLNKCLTLVLPGDTHLHKVHIIGPGDLRRVRAGIDIILDRMATSDQCLREQAASCLAPQMPDESEEDEI